MKFYAKVFEQATRTSSFQLAIIKSDTEMIREKDQETLSLTELSC